MSPQTARLSDVLSRLGYAGDPGTVEGGSNPGARDFVWQELRGRCGVQAAYFRGAVPLVAFVDADTGAEAARAQQRLWNFGRVPILVATAGDEVRAMSCALLPDPGDPDATTLERHTGSGPMHTLEAFHRYAVVRGDPSSAYKGKLGPTNTVSVRLLRNLRDLQERLRATGLSHNEVERLIGRSIFIRFLEDRKILTPAHLADVSEFETFFEVLNSTPAKLHQLFEALADRFNGDAFRPASPDRSLPESAMRTVADFLTGGTVSTGQQSLIPYDFSIIPTDLVSSVYEQLLAPDQRNSAAYYTPRRLVDLVLDEVLPLDGMETNIRFLDPACGSGIFLSEAFKRLVYRASQTRELSYGELGSILSESIFGLDISETAIGVASFGLDLTLLEYADPPTAWERARLPTLVGSNLQVTDYFDAHLLEGQAFDVVVGNPPWQSALTEPARRYVKQHEPPIAVPDNQIATAFLWRALDQLQPDGRFALVLPAKPLLHNRTSPAFDFRRQLYSRSTIETIFDLSPLRKQLFGAASAPAAVIVGRAGPPESSAPSVLLLSPRLSPISQMADAMVFSAEDIHVVPLTLAEETPDIWKTLLWGTFSDVEFLRSLRERFSTLGELATAREWTVGQGFQSKGGDRNSADHIQGLPIVPVEAIEALRVAPHEWKVVENKVMHRPRRREVFVGPHVLLRKGFGSVPVSAFAAEDAAHADSLFGIAGPERDSEALRGVAALLNSSLAQYFYFMTSSSWGVEREQLQLSEYLELPTPGNLAHDALTGLVDIERLAASGSPRSEWQGALDALIFDWYGLAAAQRDLVLESLELRMSQYVMPGSSPAFLEISHEVLQDYSSALHETLSLYLPSLTVAVISQTTYGGLAAVRCILDDADEDAADSALAAFEQSRIDPIEPDDDHASLIEPVAIVLSDSFVQIVKPNERRFWGRSNARSDSRAILAAILTSPQSPR